MRSDIHPLLASRRSVREFDPARLVSRDDVKLILEAARWAPSSFNEQPWRYLVCERHVDEEAWRDLFDCLVEGNRRWAERAPVLIVALASIREPGAGEVTAVYDVGAASLSLSLQASTLGLATHPVSGFDAARLRQRFALPEQLRPLTVIAVGYAADLHTLEQRARERESAPRVRRQLTELVAFGREPVPS